MVNRIREIGQWKYVWERRKESHVDTSFKGVEHCFRLPNQFVIRRKCTTYNLWRHLQRCLQWQQKQGKPQGCIRQALDTVSQCPLAKVDLGYLNIWKFCSRNSVRFLWTMHKPRETKPAFCLLWPLTNV